MKIFAAVISFQKIPIWRDFIVSDTPPDLGELNEVLGMFGDFMMAQEITDENLIDKITTNLLGKIEDLKKLA